MSWASGDPWWCAVKMIGMHVEGSKNIMMIVAGYRSMRVHERMKDLDIRSLLAVCRLGAVQRETGRYMVCTVLLSLLAPSRA